VSGGLVMLCDVDLALADATRIHTIEVARAFAAEGLAVDLVSRGPDPDLPGVHYESAHGSDQQRVRRIATINFLAIRLLWRRRRTVKRLYVRHSWSVIPVVIASRILGYRVVCQIDGIPYGRGFKGETSRIADYAKRLALVAIGQLAHGTVAITPRIKELLVEQFGFPPAHIAVLPNGADVDFFVPMARTDAIDRMHLDHDHIHAVFCGGFHPWVDFDLLVGAFAIVHRRLPDARLLLVGDGVERDRIERMARELQVRDAVLITGAVRDRTKVRDYLGSAIVALVAFRSVVNRNGALPGKLAEYLAAGRAVVARDVPGLSEALEEAGAGIVVSEDPQAMAEAMVLLLSDTERADQLGAAGRRAAEEGYSWRSIVRRTLALFEGTSLSPASADAG
jgi:glycosyltransferase involved in cell wall biosynthesis